MFTINVTFHLDFFIPSIPSKAHWFCIRLLSLSLSSLFNWQTFYRSVFHFLIFRPQTAGYCSCSNQQSRSEKKCKRMEMEHNAECDLISLQSIEIIEILCWCSVYGVLCFCLFKFHFVIWLFT